MDTYLDTGGARGRLPEDGEWYKVAMYMALDHEPETEEASDLCALIAERIQAWERDEAGRRYERRDLKLRQFLRAVDRVVGDLLVARRGRWLFRSLSKGEFVSAPVSYRTFMAIFEAMRALGLIQAAPGYFDRESVPFGKCTRLRATAILFDMADRARVDGSHFRRLMPVRPLVLRASSKREGRFKTQGVELAIEGTDLTRRLEREVREINGFLERHEITNCVMGGFTRIFNCGEAPGYAWDKGGRLYVRGDSYQQLNEDERLAMLIDGEPVAEIDLRASHLTILHALRGVPLDRDPYEIAGLPRSVVKAWVTVALGGHRFPTKWSTEIVKDWREEHGMELGALYPIRKVQAAVLEALPILADWPEQALTCFDLMFLESEAIVRTTLRLKREHGVPCLSVYDSIIVPASREALAAAVLREEHRRVIGVEPALKVHRPDGSVATLPPSAQGACVERPRPAALEEAAGGLKTGDMVPTGVCPPAGSSPVLGLPGPA